VKAVEALGLFKGELQESFLVLYLDGRNRVASWREVSRGTLNSSMVHPRDVFGTAFILPAAAVILLHNHPSGDPSPSPEDKALTHRMKQVGELMDVAVLDHIIITDGPSGLQGYSMKEAGVI
jgi:DNA repair protein RadC